jgi:hypothetical protein
LAFSTTLQTIDGFATVISVANIKKKPLSSALAAVKSGLAKAVHISTHYQGKLRPVKRF